MTEDETTRLALEIREALVEAAYYQIAMEKNITVQLTGPWGTSQRARVPGHWRTESEARAMPYIMAVVDVLSGVEQP